MSASQTHAFSAKNMLQTPALGDETLSTAREKGAAQGLPYAGAVHPETAYALVTKGDAVLIDVRTTEERRFVGYVSDSLHVAWQTGTAMIKNPRFLNELSAKVQKDAVLLFICRSGKRSADAAAAAAKAGYTQAFNVLEGVEGDGSERRGWRDRGLPWIQGRS